MRYNPISLCFVLLFSLASSHLSAQERFVDEDSVESRVQHLPLIFEPNSGQVSSDVRFLTRGNAYAVFLQSDKTVLVLPPRIGDHEERPSAVTLKLLGSNKVADLEGLDPLPGKSNYFLGKRPETWIAGVPQYGRVRLKSIYPGIDLVYYGTDGQLEYDFVLSPGADSSALRFRVEGAKKIVADASGNLSLQVTDGTIELQKPAIYQQADGVRRTIAGSFVLRSDNEIGLTVGDYDPRKALVIDPVLSYSTLIGASGNTQVQGVAVDPGGDIYVTGTTFAIDYPTVAAFQSKNNGTTNIFVTKLNPAGNKILYSTYLGGGGFDNAAAIAVDETGAAYITGTVGSSDFPTTPGAFMTTCQSICYTPFVTKFLSDGSLAFSTFMGGSDSPAHAIAVDSAGEAYIAGDTGSDDLPTTPGSFEPTFPGGALCTSCINGYVEKLNASGTALAYSTYFGAVGFGGIPSTIGSGIAVDTEGSAYLVGNTTGIPVQNAIQSSLVGGNLADAFIAKFSPDGSSLVYSTYFGGGGDNATGVAVDSFGNVHVVGTSASCEFPLSLQALSTICVTPGEAEKVFVTTLNSTGSAILFSTFLQTGFSSGITVDKNGNSYVTGIAADNNWPLLNPIENNPQEPAPYSPYTSNSFISELDLSGNLLFSTFLGQSGGGSQTAGIAIDGKGGIYIAGAGQGDFPLLNPIPSQVIQNTNYTIFLAKISTGSYPQLSLSPRVSPILALRNVSTVPLTIDAIAPSSNFTMGGNCGTSLPPGTGCTLILEGAADNKTSGTVVITSNAYPKPQKFVISKSPSGDSVGSILSIYPISVQFPSQLIGTTSAAQEIVIQNQGLQSAAIDSIRMIKPAAFVETNNCPALLLPFASCSITLKYKAATGQDSAQLAILADPYQTRYTVFLYGYGSTSAIQASAPSIYFGSQFVGAAPLARIVNFTNTTPYPASITGISASTRFAQTNTCTAPLAPQASCRVAVTFLPTTNEVPTGSLTASNLGPGGSQTVALYGTGLILSDLSIAPMPLPLEIYAIVGESSTGTVTLTNTSNASMSLTSFQVSGGFTQKNNCSGHLAPQASCTLTVGFDPTAAGTFSGSISIEHSGQGSPQVVPVVGNARTVFQVTALPFGQQQINTPVIGYVDLANEGSGDVTVTSITVQGTDFTLYKNECPSVFPPLLGCGEVEVSFDPTQTGIRTGTVQVMASDSSSPHIATLQGIGVSGGVGTLSSVSLAFAGQKVDTTSQPQPVTLTNTGTGVLTIASIAPSSQFTQTNTCKATLAAGASCTISVRFAPTLQGLLVGALSVQDDGAGSPHTVALSGLGK
jgi:hypothetical protein